LNLVLCALIFGFWSIDGQGQNCKAAGMSAPPAIASGSTLTLTFTMSGWGQSGSFSKTYLLKPSAPPQVHSRQLNPSPYLLILMSENRRGRARFI